MALINCPECGKEVSDKSSACIHCGYPLNNVENTVTLIGKPSINYEINDKTCDISGVIAFYSNGRIEEAVYELARVSDLSLSDAEKYIIEIKNSGIVEAEVEYRESVIQNNFKEYEPTETSIKCPKCGSTQIQAVSRRWSLGTGLLTNKVDRVCLNCKHKF